MSNTELLEALTILEQEKNISKETLLEAIETVARIWTYRDAECQKRDFAEDP